MPRQSAIAPGVRIDRGALVVSFIWQGRKCRERLSGLDPAKKENQKYAVGLKAEIEGAKTRGTFDYAKFFPESQLAQAARRADPTLGELIDILEPVRLAMPRSQSTRDNIEYIHQRIQTHGGEALRIPASQLEPRDIRKIRANMVAAGLARNTISSTLGNLRTLLDLAVEEKYISTNIARLPTARLRRTPGDEANEEIEGEADVNPFSVEEVGLLLAAAYKHRPWLAPYIQFSIYTGMRSGEKFALQWRDYDQTNESVQVVRNRHRGRLVNWLKTPSSRRRVDLCPMAITALRAQAERSNIGESEGFIFRLRHGDPITNSNSVSTVFRRLLAIAGLPDRSAYQMRHTYATLMLMGGEDPLFVSQQMGHKDVATTYRYYARWKPDTSQRPTFRSAFANASAAALSDPKVTPIRRA